MRVNRFLFIGTVLILIFTVLGQRVCISQGCERAFKMFYAMSLIASFLFLCMGVFYVVRGLTISLVCRVRWCVIILVTSFLCGTVGMLFCVYRHSVETSLFCVENSGIDDRLEVLTFPEYKSGYIRCWVQVCRPQSGVEVYNGDSRIVEGTKLALFIRTTNGENPVKTFSCGDIIDAEGKITIPEHARNINGFDYREYQLCNGLSGSMFCELEDISIVDKSNNPIYAFKFRIIQLCQHYFDERQRGIVESMLLGFRGDLSEDTKGAITQAGLSHLIAVSGLHLASLMSLLILLIGGLGRCTDKKRALTVMVLVWAFACLSGFVPSVVRAAFVVSGQIVSGLFRRDSDYLTTLSIAACFEWVRNPMSVFNIGFILSYISVLGVVYVTPLLLDGYKFYKGLIAQKLERLEKKSIQLTPNKSEVLTRKTLVEKCKTWLVIRKNAKIVILIARWSDVLANSIAVSFAAMISILPFTINSFGKVAVLALFFNLIAVPISGLIVSWGFVFSLIGFISERLLIYLSDVLILPLRYLADCFNWIAITAAENAGTLTISQFNMWFILVYYVVLFLFVYIRWSFRRWPLQIKAYLSKLQFKRVMGTQYPLFKVVACICIFGLLINVCCIYRNKDKNMPPVVMTVFDVGQGDSSLLEFDNGVNVLVDSGDGKTDIESLLIKKGVSHLDFVLATHMHDDHIGGFNMIKNISFGSLLVPKGVCWESELDDTFVLQFSDGVSEVGAGDLIQVEDICLRVLNPSGNCKGNESSIVLQITYRGTNILMCADAEEESEKRIVQAYGGMLDCDIIKIGHHGSDTSSTLPFIEATSPEVGVISVGTNNDYGHPAPQIVQRYKLAGTNVYRTDELGQLVFWVYDSETIVFSNKERVCR